MKKKKKVSIGKILALIGIVIGLITLLLPLASAYGSSTSIPLVGTITTTVGSAYAFIFGGTISTTVSGGSNAGTIESALEGPAPMALSAWILLVVGILVVAVALVAGRKKGRLGGLVTLVGGVAIAVGGILFLSVLNNLPLAFDPSMSAENAAATMKNYSLGFGFIGTGIAALVSGLLSVTGGTIRMISKK